VKFFRDNVDEFYIDQNMPELMKWFFMAMFLFITGGIAYKVAEYCFKDQFKEMRLI